MIEVDKVWHLKTFKAVLTDLRRRWDEVIHEQKDASMHCTENSKTNEEMDKTSEFHDSEESTKQESKDKMRSKTITRLESKNRPEKDKPMAESEEDKTVMMCWEKLKTLWEKSLMKNQIMSERNPLKRYKNQKMKKNMSILHYIWATD